MDCRRKKDLSFRFFSDLDLDSLKDSDHHDSSNSSSYIINEVEKYCTDYGDDFNKRLYSVLTADTEWTVKQNELLKILSVNGINDIHEGMDYIRYNNEQMKAAFPYRCNYKTLTTNELYCASQFDNWIMSDEAAAQRNALYTSSFIFNNEFSDYVNFSNDLIDHYPEAKKNKEMLREFLESTDKSYDVLSYADKTSKYANTALKVLGTDDLQQANIADLQSQMFNCKSDAEWNKLQKTYTNVLAGSAKNKDGSINLNVKSIGKALGKSTSVISFATESIDDIIKIVNLEQEVEIYQQNMEFLSNIANSEKATYAMRVAANSLLEDINLQYAHIIDNILRRTFNFSAGMVELDVWKELFGETASDILATYKLSVFISNLVIDTGDFTKQTAYTQGYAQLAAIYSDILEKDKKRFNANKTEENAWQFFEDYTYLWQLRYNGELQYEKAQHVKMFGGLYNSVNLNYLYKLTVINYNLNRLNEAKFIVSKDIVIPSSVKYMKKSIVHCPVNVLVYNSSGELIITLKDSEECDISNEYGRFAVVYNPFTDEYEKVICQTTDDDLKVEMIAVDDGLVDYEVAHIDSDNMINISTFENEKIYRGGIITTTTEIADTMYYVDNNGDGITDSTKKMTNKNDEYIKVESIKPETDMISLNIGDSKVINVNISPLSATNKLLDWYSTNNDVVEVKNGKITAISSGSASIAIISVDNPDINYIVNININSTGQIADVNTDGTIDIEDAVRIINHINGVKALTDEQFNCADVDGNGSIDIEDAVRIVNHINGVKAID